ncbi:hypothetical protein JTL32_20215 [Enterobacter cloacae]|nr:hypothetical protein [Enterobacter cloacae]
MNKCISILCLGLLLAMTEVVDASPIFVNFDMSLKGEVDSSDPKKFRLTDTRLNSYSLRPGNPVISDSADDWATAECLPEEINGGGVSSDKYAYIEVAINGVSSQGTRTMCLGYNRPETEVKSNQVLANELISKLWGGLHIWLKIPDVPFHPAPVVDLGQPVAICLSIGAQKLCENGGGSSKPVYPIDPAVTCSLPSSIELQHGTLDTKDVNGNSLSKSVIITCTGTTAVDISVGASTNSNDGVISLGGGVSSLIKVNNSAGHANMMLNPGSNSVGLSSVLSSSGEAKSGTYKGTGVLTLGID